MALTKNILQLIFIISDTQLFQPICNMVQDCIYTLRFGSFVTADEVSGRGTALNSGNCHLSENRLFFLNHVDL